MKRIATAALTLGLFLPAAPAMAADAQMPAAFDWSGFYLGAQAGYGAGDARYANIANDVEYRGNIDGWLVGGRAGYRQQIDMLVLGLSADLNWANIEGSGSDGFDGANFAVNWVGSLDAQLGWASDRLMAYAIGGIAFAGIEHDYDSGGGIDNSFDEKTHTGFTIGGGLNYAVSDNLTARIEARYYDFGREKYGQVFDIIPHRVDADFATVTLGFEFKL